MGQVCGKESLETFGKAGESLLSKGNEAGNKILEKVEDKLTESVDKIIDDKLGSKFDETLDKAVDILIDKSLSAATEIFDDGKKRLLNCALSKKAIAKMSEYNLLDPSIWNECNEEQLKEIGLNKKDIKKWETAKKKYDTQQEAKYKVKEDEGIKRLKAVNIKEDDNIVIFLKKNKWLNPEKWNEITEIDFITNDINKTEINGWKLAKETMQKEKSREFGKTVLKQWNIPHNLIKRVEEEGWIDPAYWRYLDRSQLKSMGFKNGHIQIFYYEFNKMNLNTETKKIKNSKLQQIEEEQYEHKYDKKESESESDSDKKEEKDLLYNVSSSSAKKGRKKKKKRSKKNVDYYGSFEQSELIDNDIDTYPSRTSQTLQLSAISGIDDKNVININDEKINKTNIMNWKELLYEWGIPYSLIDKLEEEGWINPLLWDNISDDDMEDIGFNKGHIALFRKQYSEYKINKRGKSNTKLGNFVFECVYM